MFARLENNIVVEKVTSLTAIIDEENVIYDESGEVVETTVTPVVKALYHEDLTFVECEENTEIGSLYQNGTFSAVPTPPVTWDTLRIIRDKLLLDCDWTMLLDSPLTSEQKSEWSLYRQSLRNLPETYPDASSVVWPEQPE